MKKKICIIHANCQGEPLQDLLLRNEEFNAAYDVHLFANYTGENIPAELISGCDLLLYQNLSLKWGEMASERICARLKESARSIVIPNMLFLHYWPLWSRKPGFDYPDTFLESLIERDLTESQILHLFMNARLTNIYNLQEIMDRSEEVEKGKEALGPVKYVDLLLDNYRQRRMFNTINHPNSELLVHTADTILAELGMNELAKEAIDTFPQPFPDFEQPIHPQVAEYLGLEFGGREERYNVYGAMLTFEEYAVRYIKCRKSGITDFITFLRAAARMK